MIADGLGYRISARENLGRPEARMGVTGNVHKLSDDLFWMNPASPRKRNHSSDSLTLRSSASTSLAHSSKELEQAVLIFIYGNVQGSTTRLHPVGPTFQGHRAVPNNGRGLSGIPLSLSFRGRENLIFPRSVAIDRDALAFQLISKHVRLHNIFNCGSIRKIDRLAHRVIRVLLERCLHSDMVLRSDVVGGYEYTSKLCGDILHVLDGSILSNPLHKRLRVNA